MHSKELRKKFLRFFEERGHKIVPSSSLIPADSSVLFTAAGMQQFKSYYLGEKSPYGLDVASCQKCFRTSDIEQVGDKDHLTFLEMLGNFSFGRYFKKEAIKFAFEFLIETCKFKIDRLWITVFKGKEEVPEDKESQVIWQKLGIPKERIYGFRREDNFWGPTGAEGPCGPTTEIHYDLIGKPCFKKKKCVPNCDCGRFIEIWNLVFNEYYQDREKKLTNLKRKGVDTGMGLERLAMVVQDKSSVFETDSFQPIIQELNAKLKNQNVKSQFKIQNLEKAKRIIVDHIKGAVFLISEGIFPSNMERGYVLRRVLRRAIRYGKLLNFPRNFLIPLAQKTVEIYEDVYPEVKSNEADILTVIQNEEEKFEKTLAEGLKRFEQIVEKEEVSGNEAFHLYDTFGFPLELTTELARERGKKVDIKGFQEAFKRHQEISRIGAEKKFGGIGKEATYESIKLHTATHLLHAALRHVLGEHVRQMGSDITFQRLRFDFSHPQKMTEDEIKTVEDLVNQKIEENLEVKKEELFYNEQDARYIGRTARYKDALESGALAFFKEKYPEKVTVYSIGTFSKEICAGPHVGKTSELGRFKIIKEESSGAGVRRIRGVLR